MFMLIHSTLLVCFFSLPVRNSIMPKNSHVLSSLFCYNDVLTPLLITDISNKTQLVNRTLFENKCKRKGDFLIQNSIYTQDNISTINITGTTECYSRLPCAHCEQEIIQIRRGNYIQIDGPETKHVYYV